MAILLSSKAANHVREQIKLRGTGVGIRLGVKTTGCSGLAYVLEYVDSPNTEDNVFHQHGIDVYVDPKSLVYIDGTELDFVRNGVNEGLEFSNPKSTGECGCGESFHV